MNKSIIKRCLQALQCTCIGLHSKTCSAPPASTCRQSQAVAAPNSSSSTGRAHTVQLQTHRCACEHPQHKYVRGLLTARRLGATPGPRTAAPASGCLLCSTDRCSRTIRKCSTSSCCCCTKQNAGQLTGPPLLGTCTLGTAHPKTANSCSLPMHRPVPHRQWTNCHAWRREDTTQHHPAAQAALHRRLCHSSSPVMFTHCRESNPPTAASLACLLPLHRMSIPHRRTENHPPPHAALWLLAKQCAKHL